MKSNKKEFVFQVKLQRLNNPDPELWGFPMIADHFGASGALTKMEGFASGGNSTLVYFSCDDCALEEIRVVGFGGRIQRGKMSIGEYGFNIFSGSFSN